jgi:4-aminobutyrate aminotransferase-like enzyme/Ser/Thr protein kinase RdoA (MazF antagonist)
VNASTPEFRSVIESVLRDEFGVDAQLTSVLAGEHDQNFRVETTDGRSLLLKIHRQDTDPAELEMQDALLRYLVTVPGVGDFSELVDSRLVSSDHETLHGRPARLLRWVDGSLWSSVGEPGYEALYSLGKRVAQLDAAMLGFEHPALDRVHPWNMLQAASLTQPSDPWAAATLNHFGSWIRARLSELKMQAIHNDANDNNILVDGQTGLVRALIDFGDVVRGPRIVGLAVAVAYAMLGQTDPLAAGVAVVSGYHYECPLVPVELELLDALVRTRFAMSIANAERQIDANPANAPYLGVSQGPIRRVVELLAHVEPQLAHASYRHACGFIPIARERDVQRFFTSAEFDPAPIVAVDLRQAPILDWSAGGSKNSRVPADEIAIGRYRENRTVYDADDFATPFGERRTVHLGIDVFVPAGTTVFSPLDGVIRAADVRDERGDYGGVIIIEHETHEGTPFWLLLGHLTHACIGDVVVGQRVARGEAVAIVGEKHENGGWPPHIHAQLYTDLLGKTTDVAGVSRRSQIDVRESISPNPAPMLVGVDPILVEVPLVRTESEIVHRRRVNLSTSLSLSYRSPLNIVRGDGASLVDSDGNRWLDLVNNVAHVGHEHPRVVRALTDQAALLNTNTRYLHPLVADYANRMRALFPDPLSVVFFTNSGSEANDLALRLARTATGRDSVLTLDWGYHGNLNSLIEISPYKFNRKGGNGPSKRIRICALPDPYRGAYGSDGAAYAADVSNQAADLERCGQPPAVFIHESVSGCGGQVELASGYLADAYARARAAGAVVIADEVQCGMGRVGTHMWAFESHGVVPDIVTLGKPIGNGHPLGIVVTTPEIARRFRTGMEYFNTFAGNPVSCAVGVAVLNVLRDERLMAHAATVGSTLKAGLTGLMAHHHRIGDVRGRGLFLGVDLVNDRTSKAPATSLAAQVVEGMKARGILVSSDGPHDNVLKIKPPMVISAAECTRVVEALDECLHELS